MKAYLFYILIAFLTGTLIPIQASTNASFSKSIGNPIVTALMVFIVGLIGMLIFVLTSGVPWPTRTQLLSAPAHSYLGGIIVATYVLMITLLVPRIGVGTSIALIVTGQIVASVIIDHFGFFGVHVFQINISRVTGLCLLIAGVYLTMRK